MVYQPSYKPSYNWGAPPRIVYKILQVPSLTAGKKITTTKKPSTWHGWTSASDSHPATPDFLIGGWPTPLKNMSSSIGMIISNIYVEQTKMFQTTNQFLLARGPQRETRMVFVQNTCGLNSLNHQKHEQGSKMIQPDPTWSRVDSIIKTGIQSSKACEFTII